MICYRCPDTATLRIEWLRYRDHTKVRNPPRTAEPSCAEHARGLRYLAKVERIR